MIGKLILVVLIALLIKVLQGSNRLFCSLLACVYLFLVLNITLMGRELGGVSALSVDVFHKYRLVFTTDWNGTGKYIAREIIGNVILFVPLGQLLTTIFQGKHLPLIATLGFFASLAIEITQYRYGLGTFEVADLIHNTIGAVCGYFIYKTDFYSKGQELWNHIRSRFCR